MEKRYITVTVLNRYLKNKFDTDPNIRQVSLRGEISNYKGHTRGHLYFTLKDETSRLNAVMFQNNTKTLTFVPEDGMNVLVTGRISAYPASGSYQIYVEEMTLDGLGNLYIEFEKLKEKLFKEGLFNKEHKKPIPRFPERIGVITADTGAAVRDIMSTIKRRYPLCEVILFPTLVQGEFAAPNIVKQIEVADDFGCDTIIVGRGGGSIEDLWAFNEEMVAKAIFECEIPVISAVGHETDTTIADYVSDLRAPTPSAAAELAVYDYRQLENQKQEFKLRMQRILVQRIEVGRLKMEKMETKLKYLHPENKLREYRQRLIDLEDRLRNDMENHLQMKKHRFQIYLEKMKGLSPLQKLNQGFSYVETEEKQSLKSIFQLKPGDKVSVYVTDGVVKASVEEIKEEQHG